MKTSSKIAAGMPFKQIPKTYQGLMSLLLIRPIHDQIDAENAWEMIELLAGHALNQEQADYLELLSDVYDTWESAQFPLPEARGAELLRLLLQERGEKSRDFADFLQIDPSLSSRILRGERKLTAEQIFKVAEHYALNPSYLAP